MSVGRERMWMGERCVIVIVLVSGDGTERTLLFPATNTWFAVNPRRPATAARSAGISGFWCNSLDIDILHRRRRRQRQRHKHRRDRDIGGK